MSQTLRYRKAEPLKYIASFISPFYTDVLHAAFVYSHWTKRQRQNPPDCVTSELKEARQVTAASQSRMAFHVCDKERFDLIVTIIQRPRYAMDGLVLCSEGK